MRARWPGILLRTSCRKRCPCLRPGDPGLDTETIYSPEVSRLRLLVEHSGNPSTPSLLHQTEIERIIEANRSNLPREERERIAGILNQIAKDENIFGDSIRGLQKLFRRLDVVDAHHYQELKERLAKATGREKKLLTAELEGQEEKLRLEKSIFEIERKLGQGLNSLHQFLRAAVDRIRRSPYPYDAKGPLSQARAVLNEILALIKEAKVLEDKLVGLVKVERKLLKKERDVV